MDTQATKSFTKKTGKRKSRTNCCVVGCTNTYINTSRDVHFYKFPSTKFFVGRRERWIGAVRRANPDGTLWEPTSTSKICSTHFVGGRKVDHPHHPAFIPTIMPDIYKTSAVKKGKALFSNVGRRIKIVKSKCHRLVDPSKCEFGTQTNFPDFYSNEKTVVMFCASEGGCLSTQCTITESQTENQPVYKNLLHVNLLTDSACGPDTEECFFGGYNSISSDIQLKGLAGVTMSVFALLLTFLPSAHVSNISRQNRLLMFLFKLKLGLAFESVAVLFGVHVTTATKVFHEVLETLAKSLTSVVFWPSRISANNAKSARGDSPNLQVTIHFLKLIYQKTHPNFSLETDNETYSVKFLIGVSPNGMINFISKAYGRDKTDASVLSSSGFLKLLEPGDEIMAETDSLDIKTAIESRNARFVTTITPKGDEPELCRASCYRTNVVETITDFKILDRITSDVQQNVDDVMKVCGILLNLQNPHLKFYTILKVD